MPAPAWPQLSISLDHDSKDRHFYAIRIIQIFLFLLICLIAIAGSVDKVSERLSFLSPNAKECILSASRFIHIWQEIAIPTISVLIALLDNTVRSLDPWKWKAIQSCLDEFRDQVFDGQDHAEDLNFKHRVTLYRLQNGSLKMLKTVWQKWLVPVARSGIITKRTSSIFCLPDNPSKIEGVVAQAFLKKEGIWLREEDVPELSPNMTDSDKQAYRVKTRISVDKALMMNYRAKSYAAIRMEVNGKPWGVLVLDSENSRMPSPPELTRMFRLLTSAIAPILEAI